MKFPVHDQVGTVRGDQSIARKCYVDMIQTDLRIVRRKRIAEVNSVQDAPSPRPNQEKVPAHIVPNNYDRVTYIAADLAPELQAQLTACLTKNRDIFAWSPSEITGVSPAVMEHKLNLIPGVQPVRQKRRHFSADQDKIIREEVNKLLKAGQIREV